jgi:hypothetical protein
MLRMVREVDPPKPSTKVSTADALPDIAASRGIEPAQLKRALAGDLDWIVMKALEKDRTRRYETANGFANDILRHLASEPVLAAPPSRAYRLWKFVRKHRGGVIAASLVLLALLAGIAGTTWGWHAARRSAEAERLAKLDAQNQQARAEQRETQAIDAVNRGIDDPPPDDAARARLRKEALEWLKAEYAAWSKLLESDAAKSSPLVAKVLAHWQEDADLAGIREEKEMAKLPESERTAFKQFWSDVGNLLTKASGGK